MLFAVTVSRKKIVNAMELRSGVTTKMATEETEKDEKQNQSGVQPNKENAAKPVHCEQDNLTDDQKISVTNPTDKISDKTQPQSTTYIWYTYIAPVVCIIVAFLLGAVLFYWTPNLDPLENLNNGLKVLQSNFTNQTEHFWDTVRFLGQAHLNDTSPHQPLVILMAAPPTAHEVVDCLARKLAALLDPSHANQLSSINGSEFRESPDEEQTAKQLRLRLSEAFHDHKAIVVYNLEFIPPTIFHSFCDTENAPYKDVSILFTVHLPNEPPKVETINKNEEFVEEHLKAVWSKYSSHKTDSTGALLSRIANTVVLVSGESEKTLNNFCHSSQFTRES